MSKSVSDEISRFVQQELVGGNSDQIGLDDDLLMEGHIDSMGIMRLVEHLESTFGIGVPPEDVTIENFASIQAIASYVSKRGKS